MKKKQQSIPKPKNNKRVVEKKKWREIARKTRKRGLR